MTATTAIDSGAQATEMLSGIAASTDAGSADRGRSTRRKALWAGLLVALIAAIAVVVGIVFPRMFAAAVALTVVVVIVAFDRLLSPRERAQVPPAYWTL